VIELDCTPSKAPKYDHLDEYIQKLKRKQKEQFDKLETKIQTLSVFKNRENITNDAGDDFSVYLTLPFDVILHMLTFYRLNIEPAFRSFAYKPTLSHVCQLYYGWQLNDPNRSISLLFPNIFHRHVNNAKTISILPTTTRSIQVHRIKVDLSRFTQLCKLKINNAKSEALAQLTKIEKLSVDYIDEPFPSMFHKLTNLCRLTIPTMSEEILSLHKLRKLVVDDIRSYWEQTLQMPNLVSLKCLSDKLPVSSETKFSSSLQSLAVPELKMRSEDTVITHNLRTLKVETASNYSLDCIKRFLKSGTIT
jgi:hypothetical protein